MRPVARSFLLLAIVCGPTSAASAAHYEVYLLGGQSNSAGLASTAGLQPGLLTDPDVMLFHSESLTSSTPADVWGPLRPAGLGVDNFGPELGLGARLSELHPGARIALIKHAVAATGLDERIDSGNNWFPGADNADTGSFGNQYAEFVQTADAGLQALTDAGHTYTIRGMQWQQGERDTVFTTEIADAYGSNLQQLAARVREQFAAPDMLFTYGTILNGLDRPLEPNLRAGQEAVDANSGEALATAGAFLVPLDDVSFRPADVIHLDAAGQLELGRRSAERLFLASRPANVGESRVVGLDFSRNLDEQGNQTQNATGELYFGSGPAPEAGPYWNPAAVQLSGRGGTVTGGQVFENLLASDGSPAGTLAVELSSGFFSASNESGATGNALQDDGVFTDSSASPVFETGLLTVAGLDSGLLYDLYFVGAGDFDTRYTIGDQTLSDTIGDGAGVIDPEGVVQFEEGVTHVVFSGVAPGADGRIEVTIAGNGQGVGRLSALQIVARVPEPSVAVLATLATLAGSISRRGSRR